MIIARWQIDARFGQKQAVIDSLTTWCREIGSQVGWSESTMRIATGSIGVLESTVELEVTVENLATLNESWDKLGGIEAHKQ